MEGIAEQDDYKGIFKRHALATGGTPTLIGFDGVPSIINFN